MSALAALGWLDWSLLAVLAVSVGVGLVRGLVYECLSLAGWVVAWLAAQWTAPQLALHVPLGAPGSALNLGVAFAIAFVLAILVWSLLAKLIRMMIHATPLSLPDRVLGAGFGLLRGAVLLLALTTVVALTPAAQSRPWRESRAAQGLQEALQWLKPLLPEPAVRLLPA